MKKNKVLIMFYIIPPLLWIVLSIWAFMPDSSLLESEKLTLSDLIIGDLGFTLIWAFCVFCFNCLIRKINKININNNHEKIIIYLQIPICVICFIANWFRWNILSSSLYVFAILLIIIVLGITNIVLYTISFIKLRKIKLIISIFMLFLTLFLSFHDFQMIKVKTEFSLFYNSRAKLINEIINKKIKINTVQLNEHYYINQDIPKKYKHTSVTEQISIYNIDKKENVIAFWVLRAPLANQVQIVYSDGGEKSIKKYKDTRKITKITKMRENWYLVIREE